MNRGLLVILLGLGVGIGSHFAYFQINRPFAADSLDAQLAWMKTELQLSDVQFNRIKALHEDSSPKLRELAVEVAHMQREFAAFETARRTTDRVDFVEFARFVETRRLVSKECLDSTRELVLASASEMDPRQRQLYLGIVAPARPLTDPLTN